MLVSVSPFESSRGWISRSGWRHSKMVLLLTYLLRLSVRSGLSGTSPRQDSLPLLRSGPGFSIYTPYISSNWSKVKLHLLNRATSLPLVNGHGV